MISDLRFKISDLFVIGLVANPWYQVHSDFQ